MGSLGHNTVKHPLCRERSEQDSQYVALRYLVERLCVRSIEDMSQLPALRSEKCNDDISKRCSCRAPNGCPYPHTKCRTQLGWRKIISLREGGFSYSAIGARMQWNSFTEMRVWKQWTDENQKTRKTDSRRREVTSEHDDRNLLRMVVNDRTASSRQLAAR
ncbi:uncharacterized protein TNCV_3231931 [Trichonephila clavipes]|nr:uncharacterized protein TNCV_3231931 [Trichonephila clavipes]